MVTINEDDHLAHYGILRKSGRYPWGSGGTQSARNKSFLQIIKDLLSQGLSEKEVAQGFGISTTQLRAAKTIAKNEQKQAEIAMAQRLKDKGWSNVAIGERMGRTESYVRTLLAPGAKDKADVLTQISEMLKREVDEKKFLDVGSGVENYIGVSQQKLNAAVAILREQGYQTHNVPVPQLGTKFDTVHKVLVPPGTTWGDAQRNRHLIQQIREFSDDGGRSFDKSGPPLSINPKRVDINYAEDGGTHADGVIYVRPGVKDVSLGNARYAQVRIQVGEGHYLKGMAMYKDDLPDGVDLLFNTSKPATGNKFDAMKPIQDDPDLPFGSIVRQIKDPATKEVTSVMNIVNEEGNWTTWSKNLSTQFLSKQSPTLAQAQLGMTYDRRKQDFDEIMALTNPTIRKKLLESFADDSDSAAVHLEAAALSSRQAWHVILPINSMPPTQVYAPNYRDGERVVLLRYPHGGTFELPEVTVNNKHTEAKKLLGDAPDVIGIHHTVAERLSGADFDGDTVIVIPNNKGQVKTSPALEQLRNFDPRASYPSYPGMKPMTPREKGIQMGDVSNLITDMTIRGASHAEIARAVRHSMVVIDAEKHELNWRQSAIDNGIKQLKTEYQGGPRAGASTLISRATRDVRVPERKPRPQPLGGPVDRVTGRREFVETGRTRPGKDGQPVLREVRTTELAEARDAHSLSSGTPIERLYADHSNRLKEMANQARLAAVNTPPLRYSPSAKQTYADQVASLDSKLTLALMNRPRERQAQVIANAIVRAKLDANPNIDRESRKKIEFQALEEARRRMGAERVQIKITQEEWDAIQAGAISNNKLTQILNKADLEIVRQLATPRAERLMTPANTARAQAMLSSGATRAQVAAALGVSLTTLDEATK